MIDDSPHIGRRLREIRAWRGRSLKAVAELAGLSESYLSRIERGERMVDKRSTVEKLANALGVAPSELTGQPLPPTNPTEANGHAGVHELRGVLCDIEVGLLDPDEVRPPHLDQIRADLDRAGALVTASDFAAAGPMLPRLVAQTRVLADGGSAEATALLARALRNGFYLTKNLGYHDVAWLVTRHLDAATAAVGDPAWMGISDFLRAEAMNGPLGRSRARRLVEAAAGALEPEAESGEVAETYGMLRLSEALQCAVTGEHGQVPDLLDEVDTVAARTGDGNFAAMHFGPRNVGVWRVALAVEMGDLDQVPHLARTVQVDAIPSAGRQASFYSDVGRGLAVRRGREDAAIEALRRAERLAPQLVHANPFVRDSVTELLRRARRDAGGRELRGLAYRLGVAG